MIHGRRVGHGRISIHKMSSADIDDAYVWNASGAKIEKNNAFYLPRSIRGLIIGKGGAGKTTLLTHLLLEPDVLDYNNISICGRSLHQPEYQALMAGFNKKLSKSQIRTLFQQQHEVQRQGGIERFLGQYQGPCKGQGVLSSFYNDVNQVPDPSELDPTRKNLLVLDDVMLSPQNKCESYYTRGRHSNCDTFYIAQNYFRLPRHTVRENSNFFAFFPQDKKTSCIYTTTTALRTNCRSKLSANSATLCGGKEGTISLCSTLQNLLNAENLGKT